MKKTVFNYAVVVALSSVLCLASGASAQEKVKADSAPAAKSASPAVKQDAPKKDAVKKDEVKKDAPKKEVAKKVSSKKATKTTVAASPASVQQGLDSFAHSAADNLNRHRLDGESRKQVTTVNGQYVARYCSIDKSSIKTSYKSPEFSKAIQYVGNVQYHEVNYECVGKTKAEAMAGPFREVNRQALTELVKYDKGKWSY